ncbi:MAG: ATP-binding protein [Bacteroidales bacterium]|nr:ATP-binding protein [Bacteroidales bacterium]
MTLIRKPAELKVQPKIKMLVYGQAGIGKTTIALSAPSPLLFDFDGGINRVNYAHIKDTVQIEKYDDLLEVINKEDLSSYETLVIDTGGKCMDRMTDYIIHSNSKMGRANGTLTVQGYSERKSIFTALCRLIAEKNKHIIFVAHRQTQQDGDDMRYVPIFGGKNYDSLVTELDLVGYMEANGRKRTITFDPTSRNDGKNTCYMPAVMDIPLLVDEKGNPVGENNFISEKIIKPFIQRLKERQKISEAYHKVLEEIKEQIVLITDAESANDFCNRINAFKHVGSSKAMAAKLVSEKAKALGLKLNKETRKYEPAA